MDTGLDSHKQTLLVVKTTEKQKPTAVYVGEEAYYLGPSHSL